MKLYRSAFFFTISLLFSTANANAEVQGPGANEHIADLATQTICSNKATLTLKKETGANGSFYYGNYRPVVSLESLYIGAFNYRYHIYITIVGQREKLFKSPVDEFFSPIRVERQRDEKGHYNQKGKYVIKHTKQMDSVEKKARNVFDNVVAKFTEDESKCKNLN